MHRWLAVLIAAAFTNPAQLSYTANGTGAAKRTLASKLSDVVSVKDFGATGDGVTDDTAAIQNAITAAAGGIVDFPAPSVSYKVTSQINVSTAGTTLRGNNSKLLVGFTDSTGGILFNITASNVTVDGLWFDATGSTTTAATVNHYIVKFTGSSGTHLTNVVVRNSKFTNMPWTFYPPGGVGAPFATHAIYAQYIDGFTVRNNLIDTVGGAGIFMSVLTKGNILDNFINNTQWYSVQFNDQVDGVLARGNRITGTMSQCRLWGGSFNLMSNSTTGGACGTPGCARIKHVEIDHNYISGAHSYTAAIHIESSSFVSFHHNIMEGIFLTQPSDFYSNPTPPDYVRVYMRPLQPVPTGNEGINDHIDISENLMVANGISGIAIYADAQQNGGAAATSDTLMVRGNRIVSTDTSNYFAKAVIVHGQDAGWKNVQIVNNQISGFPDSASPVVGLVGTAALVGTPVTDVLITGNLLDVLGGVSASTTHLGIGLDQYSQRVIVDGNILKNFWTGVRTFTNASAITYGLNNVFTGSGGSDTLFGVAPSQQVFQTFPSLGTTAAVASTAETMLTLSVSDVASNVGYITFKNGSATDADFEPFIDLGSKGTNPGVLMRSQIVTDTGTNAAYEYNARTSVPAALVTRPLAAWQNNGTREIKIGVSGEVVQTGVTFANLPSTGLSNGTLLYCSDCTIANPCASGGTGAFAKRLNGVWVCN